MTLYRWSQTAAADATADSTINWAEGQAPASVNDSARAMMAATAKYRDDIAGAIVTGGTATAYTVTSFQVFDTLAHLNGSMIAFTPHATNTGSTGCTLNVDGLGAKAIRSAPNVEIPSGSLILGTPYVATYNNSDGAWYLQGGLSNPYNVPLAAGMDYWASTAPNSAFAFPTGQAISRTTYAALFALIGTTYGTGDGSTTFNLPDKRGRVTASLDNMGGSAASRLSTTYFGATSGGNPTTLGNFGGLESETLTLAQTPTGITSANTGSIALSVVSTSNVDTGNAPISFTSGGNGAVTAAQVTSVASTGTIAIGAVPVTSNNTSGTPHPNVQPTIVCNYIIRII